ncbi:MAG: VWA domain-containing protein [Mariprofundales bacterium]
MLQIIWPWVFVLLPLPWLLRWVLPAIRQKQELGGLYVPFLQELLASQTKEQEHIPTTSRLRWLMLLAACAWLLLLIAAARPQWLGDIVELPLTGRDILMAADLSGSMQTRDFILNGNAVDRLTAVKSVANAFISERKGDRIGLILFGDRAYVQTPLTFDLTTVQQMLQEAVIGLAGKRTAIGDAIGLAVKRLQHTDAEHKVLLLLTDGANTAGEIQPHKAAQLAAEIGLRIHTIGVGADEMIVSSFFGQRKVNPSADLDENLLRDIAETTGGKYFRARNTEELTQIYKLIDQMEAIERDKRSFRPQTALYYWPLSLALLLCLLLLLFSQPIIKNDKR